MKDQTMTTATLATFGGGCFWGVEELFRTTHGVTDTVSGYMGGTSENPTYKDVCSNSTNHAEVVQLTYDADNISYDELLDIFFSNHNPTQMNRQGPDIGTQYRSVIFTHDGQQKDAAELYIKKLTDEKRFSQPIVTKICPAETFWIAEDYHQQYLQKRGLSVCHI